MTDWGKTWSDDFGPMQPVDGAMLEAIRQEIERHMESGTPVEVAIPALRAFLRELRQDEGGAA